MNAKITNKIENDKLKIPATFVFPSIKNEETTLIKLEKIIKNAVNIIAIKILENIAENKFEKNDAKNSIIAILFDSLQML